MSEKNNQIIESIYYYYKHNSLEKIKALLADYFAQQKIAYYSYVPEAYYQDLAINRYTKETAPENHLFGSVTKDAQHFT